jgi:aspartate/tyrosine/aromatic aminotransferase
MVFENVKDYMSLKQIIDLIQDHYEKMPQHIYGKIFLYRKLFEHFKENQKINKIEEKVGSFGEFLKLKDEDIFKAMFNYEKVKKGFILKEMKPLYLKLAGSEIFNEGLLNYFASNKS